MREGEKDERGKKMYGGKPDYSGSLLILHSRRDLRFWKLLFDRKKKFLVTKIVILKTASGLW